MGGLKLSFKPISVGKKIEVVSKVLSGKKTQPVAREAGVHRTSVYIWKKKALLALEETLEPRKRGPKFKRLQKTPEEKIRNLREEIKRLRGYLEEKERQIHLLKEKLEPQKDNSRPVRCPNCGCEKVYRNGTYEIRPKGFFDNLKTGKEELIQRFICPYCGKSFHIKKTKFSPRSHKG
jgi:transposase-like protein